MSAFDEMVDGRGGVRPHWRAVLGVMTSMAPGEMEQRATRLERTAEEEGASPTWRCDPVPLPIPQEEWAELEAGLDQRARLLEAVLADIYGPQAMIASGVLPPTLVFANPGFLRACHTRPGLPGRMLQSYAADLQRGPDGRWRVLADRVQAAPGIGYARDSRRLLARVMPELFRPAQVRQLRPFFDAWQDALLEQALSGAGRQPVVALLTHGVTDPQWPEHLTLSRDLNAALVQPRDLTVRDGRLYLKTLRGLGPVDVLLSRIAGATLDPLEGSGAAAGVTGLMHAARNGTVRLLNHPGAAVLEAPALAAALPALCRHMLGETLRLPTTPTLWMGDAVARQQVAQEFSRWTIRSALDPARPPRALAAMTVPDRLQLQQAMEERPWAFAAAVDAAPSVAPCAGGEGSLLCPRPVVLRLFLMHDGAGWRMMQGGLARVLAPQEHVTSGLRPGAVFKDVWVLNQDTRDIRGPDSMYVPTIAIRRGSADLPSRVADDFFWLGRYIERLEMQARLARAGLLRRARGAPLPREVAELDALQACLAAIGVESEEAGSVDAIIRDAIKPGGVLSDGLDRATWLTDALRDRLTIETYAAFNHALREARHEVKHASGAGLDDLVHAMMGVMRLAATIAGVAAEGMVRTGGWLFLDMGRRLERAHASASVLATVLEQPVSRMEGTLRMVLELFDSAITYRGRYLSIIQPAPVLDLIMADRGNPRALAFQYDQVVRLLRDCGADPALVEQAVQLAQTSDAMVDAVADAADPARCASGLPKPLEQLAVATATLSDQVTRQFFALLPLPQMIGMDLA